MDSHRQSAEVKQRIGVQLQASAYFDFLKLNEILNLLGSLYRRRVSPDDLLGRVGLRERAGSLVKHLSGGQQQRFSLAASMVNDPEVLFLDEPTTGLDPQARRSLWELVENIRAEGKTIILTTHYMDEAQSLCDRVAIMDNGRIVALDTPENLIEGLEAPFQLRVRFSDMVDLRQFGLGEVAGIATQDGSDYCLQVANVTTVLPKILAGISQDHVQILDLNVEKATLEDVFLALTGKELRD